ncbi:MAG: replicative DNA helicase [Flavobacteriales bacterium]|nr:replicative DNA helicase [Flavobacteriales bacterium]
MEQIQSKQKSNFKNTLISSLPKGKVPPQATDLERTVLGGLMIDKKGLDEVIDILSPEIFYKKEHQLIFDAIFKLFGSGQPIDIYTVSNQLRKDGLINEAGGDIYLIELSQSVSSAAHIEYHSRIIQEKYILRKLIEVSSQIIDNAYDETTDVFELLDKSENSLFEITNGTLKRSFETSQNLVKEAIKKIQSLYEQEGMSGIPSGFRDVDQVTSGWQESDLIIIAARPGMGKTSFVLSMSKNIAVDNKVPVAVFSLEMPAVQLIMRLISSETGISSEKLRKANLSDNEWNQLYSRVKTLEDAPIYIDDQVGLSIFDLRAKARRLVSQFGVKIIIVDYLQLMTSGGSGGNREQEISTISRGLKGIAKELSIPIIALSQLSRQVEARPGHKRPQLSDLRESGAIEQDADIVSFIYRPEYYKLEYWDDESNEPTEGQAEFIIAKHRNGSLENVRLKFIGEQAKFTDLNTDFSFISSQFESRINATDNEEQSFESKINIPQVNPFDSFDIPSSSNTNQGETNFDDNEMPF